MKINTPTTWQRFRRAIGLPGKTRLNEIPSERLALFFFTQEPIEQERAEFGYPTPRREMEMEG